MNEAGTGGAGTLVLVEQSSKSMFSGAPVGPAAERAVRMTMASVTGDRSLDVELQYAPMETNFSGLAMEHATVARPGRRAIVTPVAESLPEMSFDATFAYEDGESSVEGAMLALEALAADGNPITLAIGTVNIGDLWRITGLSATVSMRNQRGEATAVTAQITLTAATDVEVTLSPISSKVTEKPVPPPTSSDGDVTLTESIMVTFKTWLAALDAAGIRDPTDTEVLAIMQALWDWLLHNKVPTIPPSVLEQIRKLLPLLPGS